MRVTANKPIRGDIHVYDGTDWVAASGLLPSIAGLKINATVNVRIGNAVLVGGTVAVANTSVTTGTYVFLSRKTIGGVAGNLTYTLSAGVSFTINSDNIADTSTVTYLLVEPA